MPDDVDASDAQPESVDVLRTSRAAAAISLGSWTTVICAGSRRDRLERVLLCTVANAPSFLFLSQLPIVVMDEGSWSEASATFDVVA